MCLNTGGARSVSCWCVARVVGPRPRRWVLTGCVTTVPPHVYSSTPSTSLSPGYTSTPSSSPGPKYTRPSPWCTSKPSSSPGPSNTRRSVHLNILLKHSTVHHHRGCLYDGKGLRIHQRIGIDHVVSLITVAIKLCKEHCMS